VQFDWILRQSVYQNNSLLLGVDGHAHPGHTLATPMLFVYSYCRFSAKILHSMANPVPNWQTKRTHKSPVYVKQLMAAERQKYWETESIGWEECGRHAPSRHGGWQLGTRKCFLKMLSQIPVFSVLFR